VIFIQLLVSVDEITVFTKEADIANFQQKTETRKFNVNFRININSSVP
jgi:uncharacterized protein with HEPN domain